MVSQEPCSKCDSDDKEHYCHGCGRCNDCCPDWEGHGRGGYMESTDAALEAADKTASFDRAFRTGWSLIKESRPCQNCPTGSISPFDERHPKCNCRGCPDCCECE